MSTPATSQSFELSERELAAWRGMLRVHAELVKALDAELGEQIDLPLSSYEVLIYLRTAPQKRLRMAELSDRTLLSRSGTTRLVDRLERDGLLRRDICSDDARGCFAVLTKAGEDMLKRARPVHLAGVRKRFLDHLSDDELDVLAGAWRSILGEEAEL